MAAIRPIAAIFASVVISISAVVAHAGTVVTDGSLGPRTTLSGPNFSIGPNLGQQRGGNLFHSFSTFNLDKGEVATFTGPSSVQYVFARVTGGQPSSIDGTLRCTIPNASFYLINPSGVMFGPDAALDVKGSFAVTTADVIKLVASGSFDASTPRTGVLTTSPPAAFGFLSANPAAISFEGGNRFDKDASGRITGIQSHTVLRVPGGDGILVAAGGVNVRRTTLRTRGGNVELVAVHSQGSITADPAAGGLLTNVSSFPTLAPVNLSAAALLDTGGPGGGRAVIRAESLDMDKALVSADTFGSTPGKGINVQVKGPLSIAGDNVESLNGSIAGIDASTFGSGRGGSIAIAADSVLIDDHGNIQSEAFSSGRGGDIQVSAHSVTIKDLSLGIDTSSVGSGRGGDVTVSAFSVSLANAGGIGSGGFDSGPGGNITVSAHRLLLDNSGAIEAGTGTHSAPGGNITLSADTIVVNDISIIDAGTNGSGRAGSVFISTRTLALTDASFIDAEASEGTGNGGNITLRAHQIAIDGDSAIFADTEGAGSGGNIAISAHSVALNDNGGINASTDTAAPGGGITLSAHSVSLSNSSSIDASTSGHGRGGDLTLHAQSLAINQDAFITADANSRGRGGNLNVSVGSAELLSGGEITADTFNAGRGGNLILTASDLLLDDRGNPDSQDISTGVLALAEQGSTGNAGNLTIHAGAIHVLAGAEISASTVGPGRGGNLILSARVLTVDPTGSTLNTDVLAKSLSTAPGAGPGGDLTIDAGTVRLLAGGFVSVSTQGPGHGGNLRLSADHLIIDDHADPLPAGAAGIFANANDTASIAGDAGEVVVKAGSLEVLNGGRITAGSLGPGNGGSVNVSAQSILVDGSNPTADSEITALSTGTGLAGSVDVSSHGSLTVSHHGTIGASADSSTAGDVNISSGGTILLDDGSFSAQAGQTAGNLSITSPLLIQLVHHSKIVTESAGANGGNITIDPLVLSLKDSRINANAPKGHGGNIILDADLLEGVRTRGVREKQNVTATGSTGASGAINAGPATTDIAQSVTALAAPLDNGMLTLQPQCGQMIDVSTFLIQGRGSTPDEPGFWEINFGLEP